MADAVRQALEEALANGSCDIGQIRVLSENDRFILSHRADAGRPGLRIYDTAGAAIDLARFDDQGGYRSLKTAPNLARGWVLRLDDIEGLQQALQNFYPGRLEMLVALVSGRLETTSLRRSLNRQTGMYRIAATISDEQLERLVGEFCRSDGGCLRTILWKKDEGGVCASSCLPPQKFDLGYNQVAATAGSGENFLPLPCQEACNLLIDACRKIVQAGKKPPTPNE